MLSPDELKYHCRICMIKVELCEDDNSLDMKKSIVLSRFPELESLILVCVGGTSMDDFDTYMPNICRICFDKWIDFSKCYQLLLKTEEKLKKILLKEIVFDNTEADQIDEVRVFFMEICIHTNHCSYIIG